MTSSARVATSATPADRTVSVTITLAKPDEKAVYCRHSPAQRSTLGGYGQHGSEVCMGCRLPYAPGSPGSGPRLGVNPTPNMAHPAERPVYCRHSPSERGSLGRYHRDGSEVCRDCGLPYAPGSPGSGLRSAEDRSALLPGPHGLPEPASGYAVEAFNAARGAAQRATWVGLVILVVGIIITWGSYSAANPGGGFVVAWGAIIFGGYRSIRGLYYLDDPTRLLK